MKTKIIGLFVGALLSIVVVVILFRISDKITRHHNSFIRNFPKAAYKTKEVDLGYNSFYFAGHDQNKVYLGNVSTPLQMYTVQNNTLFKEMQLIKLDKVERPFHAFQVRVSPPYFYAYDGTVSCIYSGKVADWKAQLKWIGTNFIDQAVFLDSERIAFREQSNMGTKIGKIDLSKNGVLTYSKDILQKQSDGIFDVDGKLLFDNSQKKVVYVYTYRNEYTVTNTQLQIAFRGTTIDTISQAQISVAILKDREQQKMSQPPLKVNRSALAYGNLLFINSGILGHYEPEEMWDIASIIDIYNLADQSYVASMYIHDVHKKKMRSFMISGDQLYALVGDAMVTYKLSTIITSRYKLNNEKSTGR